ncbi:MAG: tripartite tricarboxylate transporter substrate binding protein [Betaproteobacteria bacterium]|jgi:tripartite-type tricarboxylate transporter receptor subunit TctC
MTARRLFTATALALTALTALTALAQAPAWPTKPVRVTTPFPVGSGPDAWLRLVTDRLAKRWNQPVIVENKPGGNGFIAIDAFKRGATDGHDLIQLDNVHLVAYPHLFKKLPYDPVKDFDVLQPLFRGYFFFAVPTDSKYKTVADIVADAKARPGALNYGSWSVGNPVHLGSALFEAMTGTQMQHIIYKEVPMLYTGVANGELNWALGTLASTGPLFRAGKLRYLAVAGATRMPLAPDVPSITESGGPAGFEATGWTTLAAPPGLPKAVADKLRADIAAVLADPDMKDRYATFGYTAYAPTPEQFKAFMAAESVKYADVVKRAKASLD